MFPTQELYKALSVLAAAVALAAAHQAPAGTGSTTDELVPLESVSAGQQMPMVPSEAPKQAEPTLQAISSVEPPPGSHVPKVKSALATPLPPPPVEVPAPGPPPAAAAPIAPAPVAPPPVPAPPSSDTAVWDKLAECESSGDWAINTGNGYYGGLQFNEATWDAYGGNEYAPDAHQATREQQIQVAERVRDDRGGYGSWPSCSKKQGLPQ